ncbi:hypothetical protein [Aquabacter cavernae]|uniref:hypothetical protein n=1 Tax=Aquabacter cavernae TaxID=2496029 RepID=UPI000F8F3961|nr:hypothetical protein [Aquabacter cavernae]
MSTFRAHPNFLPASEQMARGLVELYRGNRLLNRILNDRGRAIFGMFALYLDATPDERGVGLTVTRIANLCHDSGICSRGRAKAIVTLMRWGGYLEVGPDSGPNRRQRPLVPTDRMIQEQLKRWQTIFSAIAQVHPPAEEVLARLHEVGFRKALIREIGGRFHAGFRLRDYAPHALLFGERDAGLLIAWSLLISGTDGDTFPPTQPVPVPVAALSRQFFVSRAHVLKLLREAEQLELIERTPSPTGSVRLLPPMHETMLNLFGAMFAGFAEAGDSAVAAFETKTEIVVPVREADVRPAPYAGNFPV